MKKICNGHFMSPFNTEDKTFRIMRLTFIALFVFSFSLLASVHSQTMRINIYANNESTHSILEQIEQQTDYLFIYNTNEIDLNRKASVHAQDQTVMDVLSQIFRNTNIGYAIEGSNIMLMKKDEKAEQQQDNNKVSGTITDKSGEVLRRELLYQPGGRLSTPNLKKFAITKKPCRAQSRAGRGTK